jgi:hypothetical protein
MECSVLGNENPIASMPGEILPRHEFYSYEAKYLDENGAVLEIPAKLPPATSERIRQLAIKTFSVLCCEGMARVDFFLRNDEEIIVNEINTIPGFTRISMYPKLWEATGISYGELIDKLIELAIERFEREKGLKNRSRIILGKFVPMRPVLSVLIVINALAILTTQAWADAEIVIAIRYLQAEGTSRSHLYLFREDGKLPAAINER